MFKSTSELFYKTFQKAEGIELFFLMLPHKQEKQIIFVHGRFMVFNKMYEKIYFK